MHICVVATSNVSMSAVSELNTVNAFKRPAVSSAEGFLVF